MIGSETLPELGQFDGEGTLKKQAYKTGRRTMVNTVPNARPNMIVTAIATQNASGSCGTTTSTVVPAARTTGQ